jgi:hypothetical protein
VAIGEAGRVASLAVALCFPICKECDRDRSEPLLRLRLANDPVLLIFLLLLSALLRIASCSLKTGLGKS